MRRLKHAVVAVAFGLALVPAPVWAKPARHLVSPLPASDYSLQATCGAPAPGHAACLAVQLVPLSAAAKAHARPLGMSRSVPLTRATSEVCSPPSAAEGCYGLRPQDLHSAYGLPVNAPDQQTVALVDAYDDPNLESDLKVYDEEFKLPACTTANGCLTKINQNGATSPLPTTEGEWSVEISLDVEIAHATCQNCRIVLVEAQSTSYTDLETAERTAGATMGAQEISNSWSGGEPGSDSSAFKQPGVVITASTGDYGYLNWDLESGGFVSYPASSPHVVAVGGTRLSLTAEGAWEGETVWNGGSTVERGAGGAGGSGCSKQFPAPSWQLSLTNWSAVGCGSHRAFADVSADADPYTGVAVYDSTPLSNGRVPKWFTVGGTSLSSPLIAATFALAGGAQGAEYPAQTLYERAVAEPGLLHDVTSGSNGECRQPVGSDGLSGCTAHEESENCSGKAICLAGIGYDGPTGLGSPDGLGAFTHEPPRSQQIEFTSKPPAAARVGGAPYTVAANASSGLTVAFSSATPEVCTLSGSTVSFLTVGTCTVNASQAGNVFYEAAPEIQQSFTVGKGTQQIEFRQYPSYAAMGKTEDTFVAASSSGLSVATRSITPSVCLLSGQTLTLLSVGTCTIEAWQEGNANWEPAAAAQFSFTVHKGSQQISFTSQPESPVVGGADYLASATSNSGLTVVLTSATPSVCLISEGSVHFIAAGTCTIEARQEGDEDWEPAPFVQQSFTVRKRGQTVHFTSSPPADAEAGGPAYEPSGAASSGLPVSFSSQTPAVCSVAGENVSLLAAGTCTIYARQLGDVEYAEAEPWAQQTFTVLPGPSNPDSADTPTSPLEAQLPSSPLLSSGDSKPTSSFTLRRAPRVNRRTGAVSFVISVIDPGTLSWRLTFVGLGHRSGCPAQGCRPATILFGKSNLIVDAGTVHVTVKPSRLAAAALARQANAGRGMQVQALLSFQSSLGAGPFSRKRTVAVRLAKVGPRT